VIKMKAAGIKVVMLATIATSGAQVLNQMASLGYQPQRILTASACGYSGIFKTIPSLEGSYCTAFLPAPGSPDPKWQAFAKGMQQYAPGKEANIYAAWGWLAGEVAVAGLQRVKGPLTRESFVAALDTLRDFDTIGGRLTYTEQSHDGICCQFLWQAKAGRWENVKGSEFDGLKNP
jgi:ABC-type branched-subunit amino acid transport system substrate-binding protein